MLLTQVVKSWGEGEGWYTETDDVLSTPHPSQLSIEKAWIQHYNPPPPLHP